MTASAASKSVRLRFPPSPTGHWHLGGARTALFNWLFARQHKGAFILRIEDTDKERSDQKYEIEIAETMKWLGLNWDEGPDWEQKDGEWKTSDKGKFGPYRQSERLPLYRKYLEQLLAEGKAYYCYCTKEELEAQQQALAGEGLAPRYGGHCRSLKEAPARREPQVIRFKTPEIKVDFKDLVRGKVEFDAALFGDFVIARNLESPLYNFAVTVDDHEMKISHVIRGEEHLSNTPKQLLIARTLNLNEPQYGHLPLILGADRSKLSKRFAETSMLQYREDGYLPEAMLNFLVLLGWHPQDDQEILSQEEMLAKFELSRVQKAGAIFNPEKLDWLNAQYIKRLSAADIAQRLRALYPEKGRGMSEEKLLRLIELEKERMKTLKDFFSLTELFFELPAYEPSLLVWKQDTASNTETTLTRLLSVLDNLPEQEIENKERLAVAIQPLIQEIGRGQVFWPLRVAVSGQAASPDPTDMIPILGKEETLKRMRIALDKIGGVN